MGDYFKHQGKLTFCQVWQIYFPIQVDSNRWSLGDYGIFLKGYQIV